LLENAPVLSPLELEKQMLSILGGGNKKLLGGK
jgi:hypothetical protein